MKGKKGKAGYHTEVMRGDGSICKQRWHEDSCDVSIVGWIGRSCSAIHDARKDIHFQSPRTIAVAAIVTIGRRRAVIGRNGRCDRDYAFNGHTDVSG